MKSAERPSPLANAPNNSARKDRAPKDTAPKTKATIAALSVLFITVVFLSVTSVNTVRASLHYYGAKNFIEEWETKGNITQEALSAAQRSAIGAIERHSSHPLYTDTLSTIFQYQALHGGDDENAMKWLNRAEALSVKSIQKRPAWPVTWANLAYVKWLKGEIEPSLSEYLLKASTLGPHTPEVHTAIANIGLGMSKRYIRQFLENKALIKNHTLLGLRHPKTRASIISIAKTTQTQSLVCSWLVQAEITRYKALKCV